MSTIRQRATSEMARAGFPGEDARVVDRILADFFKRWDSGGAVAVMAPVLTRLLHGLPLTPLTGADDEWEDKSEYGPAPAGTLFQNVRASSVFKRRQDDGSYVYYDVNFPAEDTADGRAGHGFRPIEQFPYMPEVGGSGPVIEVDVEQEGAK